MKTVTFFKKHIYLFFLLIFAVLIRAPYLLDQNIAFGFDHGKDSLAIMHMLLLKSPKLIGPWTSIPGLYFGPAWYYLLAPAYLFGNFTPVAAVYVMVLLLLIQIILTYKYFGKLAALIMTTTPFWIMISVSAWNPFPMPFLTLIILITLKLIKQDRKLSLRHGVILGVVSSLGFHFSAAYAIFYPLAIIGILLYLKPKVSKKTIVALILSFFIPFIPQILFELRHDFVQTQGILDFFSHKEGLSLTTQNFFIIFKDTYGELLLSFLPEFKGRYNFISQILGKLILFCLLVFGLLLINKKKKNTKNLFYYLFLIAFFIIIPCIGFTFLHFNVWYVYAMMPLMILIVSIIVNQSAYIFKIIFCLLLLLTPMFSVVNYYTSEKDILKSSRAFYPAKKKALQIIRRKANNKAFASYHFVSDIYDFSYQYLYFVEARQGLPLPTEFAYSPDIVSYVAQKNDLLTLYPKTTAKPELIFFIVEKSQNQELLDNWWNQQQYSKIIEELSISNEITLYIAEP